MIIYSIDPGTNESAIVGIDINYGVVLHDYLPNNVYLKCKIKQKYEILQDYFE